MPGRLSVQVLPVQVEKYHICHHSTRVHRLPQHPTHVRNARHPPEREQSLAVALLRLGLLVTHFLTLSPVFSMLTAVTARLG